MPAHSGRDAITTRYRDIAAEASGEARHSPSGRSVVVTIGIDRYSSWPALSNAASDARGATAAFQRHGFELPVRADGSQISPLLDEAATHDAIRSLIARDLKLLTEDDRLVVFFAGHGTTIARSLSGHAAKVGYLIPVDAGDHASHEHNWIHLDTLLGEIAWLKPRHILVILDACYTGAALDAIRGFTRDRGGAKNPLASLRTKHSRRIIVSARGDERAADGGADGHSIFTAALVAALARTDRTHLTGDDLASELQRHVREHTDGLQIPDSGYFRYHRGGELVIDLASALDHGRMGFASGLGPDAPPGGSARALIAISAPSSAAFSSARSSLWWAKRWLALATVAAVVLVGYGLSRTYGDRSTASRVPATASAAVQGVAPTLTAAPPGAEAGTDGHTANSAQAEKLFQDGVAAAAKGDITESCKSFKASQMLESNISTRIRVAWCLAKEGHKATAWGMYRAVADELSNGKGDNARLRKLALQEMGKIKPSLSSLTIMVPAASENDGLEVRCDSEAVAAETWNHALPMDAGTYKITASAPNKVSWTTEVTIGSEADNQVVEIPRLKTSPPRWLQLALVGGWLQLALVGGGLLLGATTGFYLWGRRRLHRKASRYHVLTLAAGGGELPGSHHGS